MSILGGIAKTSLRTGEKSGILFLVKKYTTHIPAIPG